MIVTECDGECDGECDRECGGECDGECDGESVLTPWVVCQECLRSALKFDSVSEYVRIASVEFWECVGMSGLQITKIIKNLKTSNNFEWDTIPTMYLKQMSRPWPQYSQIW